MTVTLTFKNVTVQDDSEFGRYSCVGFPEKSGALNRIGFTVKVTPSKSTARFWINKALN